MVVLIEGYISVCSIIPFYLKGLTSQSIVTDHTANTDVHLSPNQLIYKKTTFQVSLPSVPELCNTQAVLWVR